MTARHAEVIVFRLSSARLSWRASRAYADARRLRLVATRTATIDAEETAGVP